jgi:hypothetical protein
MFLKNALHSTCIAGQNYKSKRSKTHLCDVYYTTCEELLNYLQLFFKKAMHPK